MVLVIVVVACLIVKSQLENKKGEEREDVAVVVVEPEEQHDNDTEVVEKPKVVQYDGEDPNTAAELTGVVTYAGVNDGVLMIRVNIDQYLNSGECRLELLRGGEVVHEETAAVVDAAATATCEGFNVDTSGLSSGDYQILIKVSAGGKTGAINGEVSL